MGKAKHWSEAEARLLASLTADAGDFNISAANWKRISESIPGRSAAACQARYYSTCGGQGSHIDSGTRVAVSEQQETDRRRRNDARSLRDEHELLRGIVTSSHFGDPAPGYSALDRKRAGV